MLPLSEYKKHGYGTRKQYMLPGMDPDTAVSVVMVALHEVSVTPVKKKRRLI